MAECWLIQTEWDEHWFWLSILEDHAIFIRDFLSVEEDKWIPIAADFAKQFRNLRMRLSQTDRLLPIQSAELIAFSDAAYAAAFGYYNFEGHLQNLRIKNEVNLNISPTYLNGTLDENQEYLRLLQSYKQGKLPRPLQLINLLDLWLEDQLGHALLLKTVLDPFEKPLEKQADFYMNAFRLYISQNELIKGYLRFTRPGFPAQRKFAREVALTTIGFYQLVLKVLQLYDRDELFNKTTRRFLEHHIPETCYFLQKLQLFDPTIQQLPHFPKSKPISIAELD